MGSNPINLGIRFLLELAALASLGLWGWHSGGSETWLQYILAIGIPVLAALIWGVFNVLGDPSRSGKAPVKVPGIVRLVIELAFFSIASWGLFDLGNTTLSLTLVGVVVVHYLVSYDRVLWLIKQ